MPKRQPTWPEWKLAPCGTRAAYRRHARKGEPACAACLEAERLRSPSSNGALVPDYREVRNGIPWKPYVFGQPRPLWALAALAMAEVQHGRPEGDSDESPAA